ncbi:MAG: efflux RND transporter periplasmic adaptor subunit [Paracoccaceae bacterium]
MKFLTITVGSVAFALSSLSAIAQEQQAAKVKISAAYTEMIQDDVSFIGRGEAIDKVGIVARVNGFLEEVLVRDGAEVQEGDLLFRIESSAYQATLDANNAALAKAEAALELASIELGRKEQLLQRGSVPVAERDTARANEKAAEADVASAKASIRQAELNLSYTEISAPFSGRVGRVQISEGDVISPNSDVLATIIRESPVYVQFSVNEKQFVDLLQRVDERAGEISESEANPDVLVDLPNGARLEEVGAIAFADNRVDPATGSVSVRAEFKNTKGLIVDGAFVTVIVQASTPAAKILIPQSAVQRDQRGDFVLTIGQQNTVEQRYVTLGEPVGTATIVEDGLQEGESVIVEGLQRVRPGAPVEAIAAGQSEG